MSIGILITNYNTWSLTTTSIQHCLKHADLQIDNFIVVDDCSTEQFNNQFDKVSLLRNSVNLGLVASINKGLQALDTDLMIIFDSDAWPLEDFLKKLMNYFNENPRVGIATFKTENENGVSLASYEVEPVAMSLILGPQLYEYYKRFFYNKSKKITVYTCAMVVRKSVIDDIGYFDRNYDWLELDHDFCMSATRKGWDIGIMPIKAFHKGSGTKQEVSQRLIRFYKNRLYLLKKFNKYPFPNFLNLLIVFRLITEWILINTIGRLKYPPIILADKLFSRSELITLFIRREI